MMPTNPASGARLRTSAYMNDLPTGPGMVPIVQTADTDQMVSTEKDAQTPVRPRPCRASRSHPRSGGARVRGARLRRGVAQPDPDRGGAQQGRVLLLLRRQ